jgi:hypothetical protein
MFFCLPIWFELLAGTIGDQCFEFKSLALLTPGAKFSEEARSEGR